MQRTNPLKILLVIQTGKRLGIPKNALSPSKRHHVSPTNTRYTLCSINSAPSRFRPLLSYVIWDYVQRSELRQKISKENIHTNIGVFKPFPHRLSAAGSRLWGNFLFLVPHSIVTLLCTLWGFTIFSHLSWTWFLWSFGKDHSKTTVKFRFSHPHGNHIPSSCAHSSYAPPISGGLYIFTPFLKKSTLLQKT